jgi:hypothetical protein
MSAYKLYVKVSSKVCIHALPRKLYLRTTPPWRGGLRSRHVSNGPEPHLLAELSSGAATCSSAPDLTSLPRWAPALPRVPWLRALSPLCRHPEDRVSSHTSSKSRQGAMLASMHYHVSCSFGPHLPAAVGFGATTCLAAPDLTSLLS